MHDGAERANKEIWSVDDVSVSTSKVDVAIALSVTHEIRRDVELYVRHNLPEVGRILFMSALPAPGPTSVGDGFHAWMLAEQVCSLIREKRSPQERIGSLHVFAAAPNGLMFFLGRMALGLGRLKTYEFDFEKNEAGNYRPALTLAPEEFR